MPKKIKQLKSLLRQAGCHNIPAKGSHSKWSHQALHHKLILSGKDNSDAKPYQESMVVKFINEITLKNHEISIQYSHTMV